MRSIILLSLLLTAPISASAQQRTRLPVIDMHLHAHPARAGSPKPFWLPPNLERPATDADSMRMNFEVLDRFNIVKAVTSGPFDKVMQWKTPSPGRIIGSIVFPHAQALDVASLRKEYTAGSLAAFGEVVAQPAGLSPSDPIFEPYYALCEELDIPVGVHTGFPLPGSAYHGQPKTRAALGSPLLLEEALLRHPKMRVYIMHAGYPFLEDTIALLNAHPQVYADLAGINWMLPRKEFHEYLRRLMQAGYGDRLMFGSDQMQWPEAIPLAIAAIESAPFLTKSEKRNIFYNNAARFLRLPAPPFSKIGVDRR